ncbi:MAG: lytic murein transglycosylase [Smithella sp.]
MRRSALYFLILFNLFLIPSIAWSLSDSSKNFLEEQLVAEGIDRAQAHSITNDSRLSIRSDLAILNLFCSSPRGTGQKTHVEISPRQIEQGRAFMKVHAASLATIKKRFGTSPQIITAILLIESRLGTYPMTFKVANAYASLALLLKPEYLKELQTLYANKYPQINDEATIVRARRKANWAVYELAYLVQLANYLKIDPFTISGSFAGALGPAQFLPSSFWLFGIDSNGDGIASPFNLEEAMFSSGHYLQIFGWAENAPIDQKRKAVWFYNHSQVYVNTVMMIYDKLSH